MIANIQQSKNAVMQTYENFVYHAVFKRIIICKTLKIRYQTVNNKTKTKRLYLN